MITQADRQQETQSPSAAHAALQRQGSPAYAEYAESTFQLIEDKAKTITQRKLQEIAHNNPRVRQLLALQEMADNSPQAVQLAQLQTMADHDVRLQYPAPGSLNAPSDTRADGVLQFQVTIAEEPYSRETLGALINARLTHYNNPILTEVVRYALIPSLVDSGASFDDMNLFDIQFEPYLAIMNTYIDMFMTGSLPDILAAQMDFQANVVNTNPMLRATLTTSGFEFEFLQMTEASILSGVSHLELAQSAPFLATGWPFKVETDSANEIELVTAPFLIPTLGTGSLPHPAILQRIDNLFQEALLPLQAEASALSKGAVDGKKGIQGLLHLLSVTLGIPLNLNPDAIEVYNLSYNIKPQIKEMLRQKPSEEQLAEIEFKAENEKFKDKTIASQVNFAASAEVLGQLLSQENLKEDLSFVFSPLYAFWHRYLRAKAPDLPFDYLEHVVQKLVSLYAVPLQQMVLNELAKIQEMLEQDQEMPKEEHQAMFATLANLTSFVKDIKYIWIKDDLANITKSYLGDKNVCRIMRKLKAEDFPEMIAGVLDQNALKNGFPHQIKAINETYIKHCQEAFSTVKLVCTQPYPELPPEEVKFLEHSSFKVGGRQDTYLALNQASQATGSVRRYVGELRDGGLGRIFDMAQTIFATEHARYANDEEVEELAYLQQQEKSEMLYEEAYKLYLPREEEDVDMEDPMADLLGMTDVLPLDPSTKKIKKKKKKKKKEKKGRKRKEPSLSRAETVKRLIRDQAEIATNIRDLPGRMVGIFLENGVTNTEIEQIIQRAPSVKELEDLLKIIDEVIR